MPIIVVGVNQQTTPIAIREQLAFSPDSVPAALSELGTVAAEGFILSTCNRVEIYALIGHAESGSRSLARFLAENRGCHGALVYPHLYQHVHTAAVRHLFAVAAGLDSMVLGEDQILAQVKQALAQAQRANTLGPLLHRLGHAALEAGKQVRTRTALNRNPLSVVSVALGLAMTHLGDLSRRSVVVVGAGRTAALALKHLAGIGPARVTVVNRTFARAVALAGRCQAQALPWDGLDAALADADLVVSCTSAPETVLGGGRLARVMVGRANCPLVCLDLAVPRDIDPAVAALPGVTLYDMDSLQAICADNRAQRASEIGQAEAVVGAATERFMAWSQTRAVAPTIQALRVRVETIRDAELERTLTKLAHLPAGDQAAVQHLAEALVNKLLHQPVTVLKTAPEGANMAQVVQELFGLEVAAPLEVHSLDYATLPVLPAADLAPTQAGG
ncbi:MAG: glutamyl-tRNA reductase [Chloroflexia bacterium]